MKRIYAIICAIGASMLAASAAPGIYWIEKVHNFGAFDEDEGLVTCTFRFVNSGDEPLLIVGARASCGCTQPSYPDEAVAPGDTSMISVTYDPSGRPGRFSKYIYVDSNAPSKRDKLLIEGVVIGSSATVSARYPVEFGPMKLRNGTIMFGQVAKPHIKTVFLEGYNRSLDTIRPSVAEHPKCVEVNFEPAAAGPGEQVSLICYFHSSDTKLYGFVEDSLGIVVGDEIHFLPFTAIVNEDFSRMSAKDRKNAPVAVLSSESLDFGRIDKAGSTVKMSAEISNNGRNTLEIRRIYTSDPGVYVSVDRTSVKRGRKTVIAVTVDPSELPGALLNARISVITNDPDHPVTTLRAVGQL